MLKAKRTNAQNSSLPNYFVVCLGIKKVLKKVPVKQIKFKKIYFVCCLLL